MISLLSPLFFFLNLVSLHLEECWNFPFFFIICLNFLDMRVTSSFMDPLELSDSSDSCICTFRALDKLFFSSLQIWREQNSSFVDAPYFEGGLHGLSRAQQLIACKIFLDLLLLGWLWYWVPIPWESCSTPPSLSKPGNMSAQELLIFLEELEVFQTCHP